MPTNLNFPTDDALLARTAGRPATRVDFRNEDDGSLGPDCDDTLRLLRERFEPSPETEELYKRMALIDDAVRVLGDARLGTQAAAASARDDVERSTIHLANIERELANPRLTADQREALQAKRADARARLERDQKRAAKSEADDTRGLSAVGDARVVRRNVFTFGRKLPTANPGDDLGELQFVRDPVASADAGLLVDIAMKRQGKVKRALGMVGPAEPKTQQIVDPEAAIHDCRVEVNRLRSEREGVKANPAPRAELKRKAILKRDTLARTSPIRVVVDAAGNVTLAFPQRPLGITAPSGAKLGATDVEGVLCAMFPEMIEAAIDRSLDEQFDPDEGMTAAEKKARLREIDDQILAIERIEAAAEWQRARDTGSPVRFRRDLSPRAILGLA